MNTVLLITAIIAGLSLFWGTIFLVYFFGKLFVLQKQATQLSQFALIASFVATSEMRSLKNSTIIQRVIEKYVPVPESLETKREIEEIEKEAQDFFDGLDVGRKTREKVVKKEIDVEDLV